MSKLKQLCDKTMASIAASMASNDKNIFDRIPVPREVTDYDVKMRFSIRKGHKVYKMSQNTIEEIDIKNLPTNDLGNYKMDMDDGFVFVSALNKKNAIKWFEKNIGTFIYS